MPRRSAIAGRLAKGGRAMGKPEKGMQGSGLRLASGSWWGKDPQNDTAAQRSWLYSEDVMFSAPKERVEETPIYATLPIRGDGGMLNQHLEEATDSAGMSVFSDRLVPSI